MIKGQMQKKLHSWIRSLYIKRRKSEKKTKLRNDNFHNGLNKHLNSKKDGHLSFDKGSFFDFYSCWHCCNFFYLSILYFFILVSCIQIIWNCHWLIWDFSTLSSVKTSFYFNLRVGWSYVVRWIFLPLALVKTISSKLSYWKKNIVIKKMVKTMSHILEKDGWKHKWQKI